MLRKLKFMISFCGTLKISTKYIFQHYSVAAPECQSCGQSVTRDSYGALLTFSFFSSLTFLPFHLSLLYFFLPLPLPFCLVFLLSICLSVYRLSHSCTLLQPLDGIRCHLPLVCVTVVWSQVAAVLDRIPCPTPEDFAAMPHSQITLALVYLISV